MSVHLTRDYITDLNIQNLTRQKQASVNTNTGRDFVSRSASTQVSYDTVSFEQKSARLSDHDFASALAKAYGAEVRQGVSDEKVAEIKTAVQSGQYQPNSMLIAQHILGHQ